MALNVKVIISAKDQMSKTLGGITKSIKASKVQWQAIGKIAAGVGIAGAVALGSAAMAAADFQHGMAEVATLVDTSVVSIADLSNGVRALALDTGKTTQDLTGALYQAISAGIDAGDAITFMGVAAKTAVAGATDVETAVDGLTGVLSSWGLEAKDATEVSDSMFVAMKMGKLTISELSQSYAHISATAAAAGLSVDETNAAIAAITTQNMKAGPAARALNQALWSLIKPGAEAKKIAKGLKVEIGETALRTRGLSGMMEDLSNATGGSVEKLGELLGSTEAAKAALALTGVGGEKFALIMEAMGTKTGATETAYDKMSETAKTALDRFKALIADIKLSVGDVILSSEAFDNLTEALGGLNDKMKEFNADPANSKLTEFGVTALAIITVLGLVVAGIALVLSAVSATVIAIVVAIGAAVAGILVYGDEIVAGLKDTWERIKVDFQGFADWFVRGWDRVVAAANKAWQRIRSIWAKPISAPPISMPGTPGKAGGRGSILKPISFMPGDSGVMGRGGIAVAAASFIPSDGGARATTMVVEHRLASDGETMRIMASNPEVGDWFGRELRGQRA